MPHYQDHTWRDIPDDKLVVAKHNDGVSLCLAGYIDGSGFGIKFQPRHTTILYELIKALENLDAKDEQGEE